jgi:hypothetical protein
MAMTMTTARVGRRPRAVRQRPGKGQEQWIGWGKGRGKGKGKGRGRGRQQRMERGRGRGRETENGKVSSNITPGGDDIHHVVAVPLKREIYKADSEMEG